MNPPPAGSRGCAMQTDLWDILIIDADDKFRSDLSALLHEAGYSVRQAANGREGLSELNRAMPSLVMLALNVPDPNGFELLKVMRERPLSEQAPVAIIAKFGFAWESALVGADGCIQKPLQPQEALRAIDFLLNKKNKRFLH